LYLSTKKHEQDEPYRFAVFSAKDESSSSLILNTNYHTPTKEFTKELKGESYAHQAVVKDNMVVCDVFALNELDRKKYEDEDDYLSIIQMELFNKVPDTNLVKELFHKTKTSKKLEGNEDVYYWLKSYYHLYKREFTECRINFKKYKKVVDSLSESEQNRRKLWIKTLKFEIDLLEIIEAS